MPKHFGDLLFKNIIKYLCSILSLQSLALYRIFSILKTVKVNPGRTDGHNNELLRPTKCIPKLWLHCGTPRSGLAVGAQVWQVGFPKLMSSGGSTDLPLPTATKGKPKNPPRCFWHGVAEPVGRHLSPLLVWRSLILFHCMQNNLHLCSFLCAGCELARFCGWILLVPLGTGGTGSQQLSYRGQGCFRVPARVLSDEVCCRIGWGLEEGQDAALTWGNCTDFSKSVWKGCGSLAVRAWQGLGWAQHCWTCGCEPRGTACPQHLGGL